MNWYLEDIRRLRDEREAIEALALEVDWLRPIRWHMDDQFRLIFEAEIVTAKRSWPITLQYPSHFPRHPPLVLPRGEKDRWSKHQWGSSGELCTEWGPDNWTKDMTGVMQLKSAYKLLADENPPDGSRGKVATRHSMTLGQEMRTSGFRLFVTPSLRSFLDSVAVETQVKGYVLFRLAEEVDVYLVYAAGPKKKEPIWRDPEIPEKLVYESIERDTTIIRLAPTDDWPQTASVDHFCDPLIAKGFILDPNITILLRGDEIRAYQFLKDNKNVYRIDILEQPPSVQRLDAEHAILKDRIVTLVGCGSLGSKIAVSLARAGVGKFILVDDDILFPDNFVRNELDWREVGTHKVDSVARAIQLANPAATAVRRKHRIGGQEASSAVGTLFDLFDGSDLIVDATANPSVFNAVSETKKVPLVWGEVFGGGFGGLIARYRPGVEPDPQLMRRAIENWFHEYGPGIPERAVDYTGSRGDGPPMIADDADATVIAAHMSRFAIDLLIKREPSMFPHSVYAIGLAEGNVFSSPFDTRPIDVGPPGDENKPEPLSPEEATEEYKKIGEILGNYATEAQAAAKNNK